MSGAGFLCATMSPANTLTDRARSAPTACSRVACTETSAEVEATASGQPAARASPKIRAMPGRGGTAPEAIRLV
jgi:hypothetical protein